MKYRTRKELRQTRHRRIRRKISGTADRPRMSIMVSGKNIYVQFIDDDRAATIVGVSTLGKENKRNSSAAAELGKRAAAAAADAGIQKVVVDRGGHRFHGRVKAIVDAVAEAGLVAVGEKSPEEVK